MESKLAEVLARFAKPLGLVRVWVAGILLSSSFMDSQLSEAQPDLESLWYWKRYGRRDLGCPPYYEVVRMLNKIKKKLELFGLLNETHRYRYPISKQSLRSRIRTTYHRYRARLYERHRQFILFGKVRPNYIYNPWDPVHQWFGLTYASYLVLPRSALQQIDPKLQRKLVEALTEITDRYDWPNSNADYQVTMRDDKGRYQRDLLSNYRHPEFKIVEKR
jgi:hypothetical protein